MAKKITEIEGITPEYAELDTSMYRDDIMKPEKYEKQLIGQRVKNELPQLIYVNDNKDEARYIFYKIWQYHMEGVPFKDMAVLIRNAQDSTQLELLIQEYSGKKTIPFQKFGGLKYLPYLCTAFANE